LPPEAQGRRTTSSKRSSDSVSTFSDKENYSQQPKERPKKNSTDRTKRGHSSSSQNTVRSKKKTKKAPKQTVSDDSSTHASFSKTSRSVLGDVAKTNLQRHRVSYTKELTMTGRDSLRARKPDDDDDDSTESEPEEPEKKKRKTTKSKEEGKEGKDDPQVIIEKLTTKLGTKNATIKDLQLKIANLHVTIEDRNTTIEELELKNATLVKQKGTKQLGVPLNKAIKLLVNEEAKGFIWKRFKFIADDAELDKIMEMILMKHDHTAAIITGLTDDDKAATIRNYSLTYGPGICDTINSKRSTTQSAICDVVLGRKKTGKRIPSVANLLLIIRRKGLAYSIKEGESEPTDENKKLVDSNRDIFDWYVDKLVPKVVGFASWGPNQKHYGNLSTFAPGGETEPYVPANAEAFIQLLFENAETKWKYLMRCQARKDKPNKRCVHMDTKYSSARSGHNNFGGWNQEGRNRFEELRKKISQ
jgi:hypothetical protein